MPTLLSGIAGSRAARGSGDHADPPPRSDSWIMASRSNRALHLRSEEHTSELQSRLHLVCRLLLEKKKKNPMHTRTRWSMRPDRHIGYFSSPSYSEWQLTSRWR